MGSGGVERLLDFIYLGAGASNGYDQLGHFLRAELIANQCQTYAVVPAAGCSAISRARASPFASKTV